jgi:uncharacterized cupredoxin-like copper-binding protein
MRFQSFLSGLLAGTGMLFVTGCASNVELPKLGDNHPANPQAAAAPLPPPPTIPEAQKGMEDMQRMRGMEGMQGMQGMQGMNHGSMQRMEGMEGMSNAEHGAHEHADEHGASAAGRPGDESRIDRMVKVTAYDTMRYKPQTLTVEPGETIRFVVTNAGKIRHEFVIGTAKEQHEHEEMMKQMPHMMHEDQNALTLEPGETKPLIWQFGKAGLVEFTCHVLGHYPAGMVSKVFVGTAGAPSKAQPKANMDDMQGIDHDMQGMDHSKHMQDVHRSEPKGSMHGDQPLEEEHAR